MASEKAGDVVGFDIIYAQGRQAQQVPIRCLALRKQSAGNMTADKAIAETFKNTVCVLSLGVSRWLQAASWPSFRRTYR